MASVSVTHLIIFIASMIVAASVAGVLITEVEEVSSALSDRGEDVSAEIGTDISIISDPRAGIVEGDVVELLVKNTGTESIAFDEGALTVLLNGELVEQEDLSVEPADTDTGADRWQRGEVAEVTITRADSIEEGDDVRVVVQTQETRDTIQTRAGEGTIGPESNTVETGGVVLTTGSNSPSTHTWTASGIDFTGELRRITVDYDDALVDFDGLTDESVTVTIEREASENPTSEIEVDPTYDDSSATFELSELFNTVLGGFVEVEIDSLGQLDTEPSEPTLVLEGDDRVEKTATVRGGE